MKFKSFEISKIIRLPHLQNSCFSTKIISESNLSLLLLTGLTGPQIKDQYVLTKEFAKSPSVHL